jgi:hypothetical protein
MTGPVQGKGDYAALSVAPAEEAPQTPHRPAVPVFAYPLLIAAVGAPWL